MRDLARVWAVAAVVYATATQVIHILYAGGLDLSASFVVYTLAVPAAQLGLLALAARLRGAALGRYGERFGRGGFVAAWGLLLAAHGVTTVALGLLVFRLIDVTVTMVAALLWVPAAQAAAVVRATSMARMPPWPVWRAALRHPLVMPVLAIDGIMLAAGLLLPSHPLLGLAEAGVMQRRWMATKCVAAAIGFAAVAMRARAGGTGTAAGALAVALAAIGVDGFTYWLFESAAHMPTPLALQPLPIIWLEVFGSMSVFLLAASLRTIRRLPAAPAAWARAALVLMFFALLSLLMNGFLSWLPVQPWAGLAMTLGSLSASAYAVAAVMAVSPPPDGPQRI